MANPWKKVVPDSYGRTCKDCDEDFPHCECIRRNEPNTEYKWINGVLWGRRK